MAKKKVRDRATQKSGDGRGHRGARSKAVASSRASGAQQHFVTFYSPGTFISEADELPIAEWDTAVAVKMAGKIRQRYGARPYGFRFTTRARGPHDLDSKVIKRSGFYFIGGRVETLAEVEARNDPKEKILLSNMRSNGWARIVVNDNSYRSTFPLDAGDVILKARLPKLGKQERP